MFEWFVRLVSPFMVSWRWQGNINIITEPLWLSSAHSLQRWQVEPFRKCRLHSMEANHKTAQYATWNNRLFQVYSAITVNHSWCLAWLGTPGKQGIIITVGRFQDLKPRSMPEPSARKLCKRTWMWEIPFPSDNYWKTDRWTHLQDCQLPGLSEVPALG